MILNLPEDDKRKYNHSMSATRPQKHNPASLTAVITALGIVYGDIGTSPLYALREAFNGHHGIPLNQENVFGVLSLIVLALILSVSVKYLEIIMRADNRGEGGVLALTALACLKKDKPIKYGAKFFLALGLFGATLFVSDSLITPAISVLSAVEGLKIASPAMQHFVLPITIIILCGLFWLQQKGTAKIGKLFGPIMLLWFAVLGLLGLLSIIATPEILLALSPHHAIAMAISEPGLTIVVMGAVFLVVTGGEALYADMGHLGRLPIAKGWFYVALPGLLLNYFGQGALILRSPEALENPFYLLAPDWALYPLLILATCATVIASQAVISGFYSLASQCVQLGYCPRLNIVHTSADEAGQIYIPSINWFALVGTILLVLEFKSSSSLASAYGISVSLTMFVSTTLVCLVAHYSWNWSWLKVTCLIGIFFALDIVFLIANSLKIVDGGWVPLTMGIVAYGFITSWKKGRSVLADRLRARSYPFANLLQDIHNRPPTRVSGTGVFMIGDPKTTPPALLHNLRHNKILHETVVFLTILNEEAAYISEAHRVSIENLGDGFYRIIGHYGFMERPNVLSLMQKCESLDESFHLKDPTFFLGREILVSGTGKELSFWRKLLFGFMAKNAASANSYFSLPLDRVIEVGMQVEL